jgi:DNA-binding MarR family transcriptional regulator
MNLRSKISSEDCYGFRTAIVARFVLALHDTVLQFSGISSAGLHVLLLLEQMPDATAGQLRDGLHADLSTVLHLLRTLRRRKLIEYGPVRAARRKTYRITPAGRAIFVTYCSDWKRAQVRVAAVLGHDLLHALADALPRICVLPVRGERARMRPINYYDFKEEAED